jgi:hypothetical protein
MSNSKNVSLFDQLNSSKKRFLIDKNLSYNNKRTCELFNNNIKEPSYAKMIIEVFIRKEMMVFIFFLFHSHMIH